MATSGPKSTGGGTWGTITGNLADQTDLINFLAATYLPIASFTSSFNAVFATKSTSDLAEGSNLYYTASRFNSAFSAKSTSDLSEGSNLYFTEERVDDRVNSLLQAGSNIGLAYDDVLNTLTISSTANALDLVSFTQYGGF